LPHSAISMFYPDMSTTTPFQPWMLEETRAHVRSKRMKRLPSSSIVPGKDQLPTSQPLSRAFYDRDPREVGPDLLGKILVRKQGRDTVGARIVEVEAYLGAEDPAAHASIGKTSRNAVLFGSSGYAYVYFIYGNHYCLNVSCLPDGMPGGILFRALEPLE